MSTPIRFPPPTLTPLAALVDALGQDVAALDLHLDADVDRLTPDEVAAFGDAMVLLLAGFEALRIAAQKREGRAASADATGHP